MRAYVKENAGYIVVLFCIIGVGYFGLYHSLTTWADSLPETQIAQY